MSEIITSRKNAYIKELLTIKKSRGRSEFALIEGYKLITEAAESGLDIKSILVSDSFKGDISHLKKENTRVIIVNDSIIELLASTESPQGIVALTERIKKKELVSDELRDKYIILEEVQDPGNVGTVIRTSEALGFDGVVLCGACADIYNDKTLRSTMGSAFRQNIYYAKGAADAVKEIRKAGIKVYAACLGETSSVLGKNESGQRCAFIIGNESRGVSEAAVKECDGTVIIPMSGPTESLNAAVAAGIIMWEAVRRRNDG